MSDVRPAVELLQALIRNTCVNTGDPASGQEVRNAATLRQFLGSSGLGVETYESSPGRVSLVARIDGTDPDAPALCLAGHTDVVPVDADGWIHEPFGGELIDGEVWGRGAVDMLNLTATMAVAVRDVASSRFRPRGDLIFLAVADEESGGAYGAQFLADHHPDAIACDFALTEGGGVHGGSPDAPVIALNTGEKGVSWRRLTVRGEPGHGSMPFRKDSAMGKAAMVVQRLGEFAPPARLHELWEHHVAMLDVSEEQRRQLLDPAQLDGVLTGMDNDGTARHLHACSHTTFSCDVISGGTKTNVIPDRVDIDVDIRTLPGEDDESVRHHLDEALGELAGDVEVSGLLDARSSTSQVHTALWSALERAIGDEFPHARVVPNLHMGFTDARILRAQGAVAYGAGLFDPGLDGGEFGRRFHGYNERIDLESLRLTTRLWSGVIRNLLG
jgi:acetylornithine deacetylase/succinyl-diaminopimelate desuccinylase-like protein